MGVRIRDKDRTKEVLANIRKVNQRSVDVGYITGGDYAGGKITTKGLARVHEYGVDIVVTPAMRKFFAAKWGKGLKASTTVIRIPERAFIRGGAMAGEPDVLKQVKQTIGRVLLGQLDVIAFYELLGDTLREAIQEFAYDLDSPGNAALTIEDKGFDDPLVRSGEMLQAIEVIMR